VARDPVVLIERFVVREKRARVIGLFLPLRKRARGRAPSFAHSDEELFVGANGSCGLINYAFSRTANELHPGDSPDLGDDHRVLLIIVRFDAEQRIGVAVDKWASQMSMGICRPRFAGLAKQGSMIDTSANGLQIA
jgi:hypothetical protein